jgi:hypothetical protein
MNYCYSEMFLEAEKVKRQIEGSEKEDWTTI